MRKPVFGVIIGHRNVFPGQLAADGRAEVLGVLEKLGVEAVLPGPSEVAFGAISTYQDAKTCAKLFQSRSKDIEGILVCLPNFGDERAVADTIKLAGLNVPVFVQAWPDDPKKMGSQDRRDSFCGKISVCNNLRQYGILFTIGDIHCVHPASQAFADDLAGFAATCRVVNGVRKARLGCIGARTTPFKTVRYSEKLLEASGISIDTADLSEILAAADKLDDNYEAVKSRLRKLKDYCPTGPTTKEALKSMARFAAAVDGWVAENELDACAIQCWPALQGAMRIFPCAVMGIMSDSLMPAACETDVTGAISMYALQLASGRPSALMDWNNNYGDDPNKLVYFHCSNAPKSMLDGAKLECNAIAAKFDPIENTYGCCYGRLKPGPFTYTKLSTDDVNGEVMAYVGEGEFTEDKLDSFGAVGVADIPGLQDLLKFICLNGFEHHVAINHSQTASAIAEAFDRYMGWSVYRHS